MWQVHGKPKFKTKLNKYVIDYKESKATQIKTGDIIYIEHKDRNYRSDQFPD